VHSSLDTVGEEMWKTQAMYLKTVDKFNEQLVSAFVTAGQVKFMLLHEARNEDGIKNFFNEVHELYIKLLMNPFYTTNTKIFSPVFDARVHALAKRFLGTAH
jgi:trafficking protein particle complex subunit 2